MVPRRPKNTRPLLLEALEARQLLSDATFAASPMRQHYHHHHFHHHAAPSNPSANPTTAIVQPLFELPPDSHSPHHRHHHRPTTDPSPTPSDPTTVTGGGS